MNTEHTEKKLAEDQKHILKWNILSEREKDTHTLKKKLVFWARRNADDNDDEEEENTTLMNKA